MRKQRKWNSKDRQCLVERLLDAFGLAWLFPNDSTDSPGEHSAVYFIPRVEAPEMLLKSK